MLPALIFYVEDLISTIVYLLISFYLFVFLKFLNLPNGNLEFNILTLVEACIYI
jgi:hypothetical protein